MAGREPRLRPPARPRPTCRRACRPAQPL